jgi:hypothetical protein
MDIKYYKPVTQSITLDPSFPECMSIRISHWAQQDRNNVSSVITMHTGACNIQVNITPDEARRLAAKLLDHAADVDTLQIARAMAPEAA